MFELYPRVPVDSLTHDLLFEMPDMPDEVAEHLIVRAAMFLARYGNILRRETHIHIRNCAPNYDLEVEDDMDFVAILGIRLLSSCCCKPDVRRFTLPMLKNCYGISSWVRNGEIWFNPARVDDVFCVDFCVSPRVGACDLDAGFAGEFYETLLAKAKSLAFMMPQKAWSNPSLAVKMEADARLKLSDLSMDLLTGRQRGMIRVSRPRAV